MQINNISKPPRIVKDWEFEFLEDKSPSKIVSVDETIGDTVQYTPDEIIFNLVEQPSVLDPSTMAPAMEIHINRSNYKTYTITKRAVLELTPEQRELWKQNVERFYGTKQEKAPSQLRKTGGPNR